jgi:hypothetical protein
MFYHPLISRLILSLGKRWLLGKRVLVGITEVSATGEFLDQRQFVGRIMGVYPSYGIRLQRPDASYYDLPPDHRALKRARKGEYKLRSTGEVIVNPDFLSACTITKPPVA